MAGKPRKKAAKAEKSELERVPTRKLLASIKLDIRRDVRKAITAGDLPHNWKNR